MTTSSDEFCDSEWWLQGLYHIALQYSPFIAIQLTFLSYHPSLYEVTMYTSNTYQPWCKYQPNVRVPWGWTWIRLIKFFSLQILVAQVIPIGNPLDDIASPLGISSNMLIKAAIARNPFLPNIGRCEHPRAMKMVSIPRFSRSRNHMRPFLESWDDCIITYSIWLPWRVY